MASSQAERTSVPDAVAPPPLHPRFPLSDGARAFAVVGVMVVHVWLFTGGFGGFGDTVANRFIVRVDGVVALFFFLSGFLLYRPMIAHRAGGPPSPGVRDYARRRFLRIYPAFWVALTVLAIVPGLAGVFTDDWLWFYSLGFYLDFENASQACIGDPGYRCGLPQSWTLTVEMTFYLMLPFYAMLTAWIAKRRDVSSWIRLELLLIALLAAASLLAGGFSHSLREDSLFRFSFFAHFLWLGLGLAAAVLSVGYHNRRDELPRLLRLAAKNPGASWALALAIWLVQVFTFHPAPFTVMPANAAVYILLQLVQALVASLIMIPVVFGDPNRGIAARLFGHPLMVWVGLISYGLYLWSVTITVDLGVGGANAGFWPVLILTFVFTLPLAAASYYFIERPLMKLKYKPLPRFWRRSPGQTSQR